MPTFRHTTHLPHSPDTVFGWHTSPSAFERLSPPWDTIRKDPSSDVGLDVGNRVKLHMRDGLFGVIPITWVAEHTALEPTHLFSDRQVSGPFAEWIHDHRFEAGDGGGCKMVDEISFRLPLAPLSNIALPFIRKKLERVFAYRHRLVTRDLEVIERYPRKKLKIVISGASGLVGRSLTAFLEGAGHEVTKLVRRTPRNERESQWNPANGVLDQEVFLGKDAVINLSGEPIAEKRWTEKQKARIRRSRIETAGLISKTLAQIPEGPPTFLCASAIGIYGDSGATELTEDSKPNGSLLITEVGEAWEAETEVAAGAGIRTVNLRIGIVLSPAGGALGKMLLPFTLGVAGRLGSGDQYMSWIALDDLIYSIYHLLMTESVSGPVNLAAPKPVTNTEFTKTLGRVLCRPTVFPAPAFALRLALGQMADELLLSSMRVVPKELLDSGFQFSYPDLDGALRHLLGR